MIKKFLLFALVILPALCFAQEAQKIAYLNQTEVIMAMPEYKMIIDSLEKKNNEFQTEFNQINEDFTKKYTEYLTQRESLNESIRLRREKELEDLRVNSENFQQYAQQVMDELQQSLFVPVNNKLLKTIEEVAAENNFLYVFRTEVLLYTSPSATDATPLVKKKLGIQ